MRLRTLIVDDEPLARRGLALRLARHADIDIVAEAGNGREAFAAICEHLPALMFLDVQMPGDDGFELLRTIPVPQLPLVVFVTAYHQYALQAFETNALDYLLKPIDDARLDAAIERARQGIAARTAEDHRARLLRLLGHVSGSTTPTTACVQVTIVYRSRMPGASCACRTTISCGSTRQAITCACIRQATPTYCARRCANWRAASIHGASSAFIARPSSTWRT